RALLAPLVKNRRVLNTFSYTGAFSVFAALAGAAATVSVDLSKRALDWSKRNFELNGLDPEPHLHVKADVLDYLNLAHRKDFSFDVIIHDPPTFSTAGKNTFRAGRDWPRLLKASFDILAPGGWLACSSNTRSLSESEILRFIKETAEQKNRSIQIKEVGGVPRDFPAHPQLPEMDYLKFVLVRVE
ncbi:MAG: class I SAM-dependent methyltransferase, partial [Planctomycetes bacterium]|nr:class I SAM-dependent methyltransferase [Planctomycetota bacterium]